MTDAFIGHDCSAVEFFCDDCTNEFMGDGWAQEARRRAKH